MTDFNTRFNALIAARDVLYGQYAAENWVTFDQAKYDALLRAETEIHAINAQLDALMAAEETRRMEAAGLRPRRAI